MFGGDTFDTEEDAIEISNDTEYGLAVAVWRHDLVEHIVWLKKMK